MIKLHFGSIDDILSFYKLSEILERGYRTAYDNDWTDENNLFISKCRAIYKLIGNQMKKTQFEKLIKCANAKENQADSR